MGQVEALNVTRYHLEKSGDHNDVDTYVFEVPLYVASCSECLNA